MTQPPVQPPGPWRPGPQQPMPPQYGPPPGYLPPPPQPVYYGPPPPHPAYAVTKVRKDTSHTFHLLMTLFTCGSWALFVWLPIIIWNSLGPRRKVKTRYR